MTEVSTANKFDETADCFLKSMQSYSHRLMSLNMINLQCDEKIHRDGETWRQNVRCKIYNLPVCATCILSRCLSAYPLEWKRSLYRNERSMTRPFCTRRWTAARIDISPLSWTGTAQRASPYVRYALRAGGTAATKVSIFAPFIL